MSSTEYNFDPAARLALLGGSPVAPLPEGETIPRSLYGTPEEIAAVSAVVADGRLGLGKYTEPFANAFANTFRVRAFVPAANGSLVIGLALQALGVGEGDEVWVPALTFQATAGASYLVKAVPTLTGVLEFNYTMDPDRMRAEIARRNAAGEALPKAIIVVPVYSMVPRMRELWAIAKENGMFVLLDFAHGPYAEIDGEPITRWADLITYSFQQSKTFSLGEGGGIAMNDERWLPLVRMLVSCGYIPWDLLPDVAMPKYGMPPEDVELPEGFRPRQSVNYRMTELQAALAVERLRRYPRMQRRAAETMNALSEVLREFDWITPLRQTEGVTLPQFYKWGFSVAPQFMDIVRFRAAMWEETNFEWIFPYPALSMADARNPLYPGALGWVRDEAYLERIANPAHDPIAEDAVNHVALVEWMFLQLPHVQARRILRTALLKVQRNRSRINVIPTAEILYPRSR